MNRIAAARGPAATLMLSILVAACGGAETDAAPMASGQAGGARQAALARVDASLVALAAPAGEETAFHGCMRRLNVALRRPDQRRQDLDVGCLAGTYFGQTYQGDGCALRIVPNAERASLVRKGNVFEMELPPLRAAARERSEIDVKWADVEVGHLGLQFVRRAERRGAAETMVVTSGPPQDDKPAAVGDMTYERVEAGRVLIVRCRFDA
jgi:hypothetical protein